MRDPSKSSFTEIAGYNQPSISLNLKRLRRLRVAMVRKLEMVIEETFGPPCDYFAEQMRGLESEVGSTWLPSGAGCGETRRPDSACRSGQMARKCTKDELD